VPTKLKLVLKIKDVTVVSCRVQDGKHRALFESSTCSGLWYAETKMPTNGDAPADNPYDWDMAPCKLVPEGKHPNYKAGEMTCFKYRSKAGLYFKKVDLLRYHNELFDSDWIEALTTREIAHCELLRKHPHPNICRYHGVDHKKDLAITGIYFDRYDTTLQDLVEAGKQFDPQKCIEDIRAGLKHIHSLGFVHSDIKPENIFVNVEAHCFVIDDFDSMQKQGEHVVVKGGTHGWLPEGVVGNANHVANIGDDWYVFHMIIAWIRRRGNGRPIKGETYLDTEEIFLKAQEKKEILQ